MRVRGAAAVALVAALASLHGARAVHPADAVAMEALRLALVDAGASPWAAGSDPCTDSRVVCFSSDRVKELLFTNVGLQNIPAEIGQLTALQELRLGDNQLTSVPAEIGQMTSLVELRLGGNKLTSLPVETFELSLLEILWLGDNQFTSVPAEIGQLTSLVHLSFRTNLLTSLPAEIGQLPALEILTIFCNCITPTDGLPRDSCDECDSDEFGQCPPLYCATGTDPDGPAGTSSSDNNDGIVVGAVAGFVVGAAAILGLWTVVRRNSRAKAESAARPADLASPNATTTASSPVTEPVPLYPRQSAYHDTVSPPTYATVMGYDVAGTGPGGRQESYSQLPAEARPSAPARLQL